MSKEEIIRIIKCYEQDRYFGVLPEDKYECVANDIFKLSNQNTKPLIEKISSLEASLLDVTRKSCARVDELTDEIAKLKASKSEANEAVEFAEWLNTRYCPHETEPDVWIRFINLKEKTVHLTICELFIMAKLA